MRDDTNASPTASDSSSDGADAGAGLDAPAPGAGDSIEREAGTFFVVGIGASAGGLEAVGELLRHVPPGMAYVVVLHLAPDHDSMLTPLLARGSRLPVVTAVDAMALEPGRVHVIPPNADLAIADGSIRVTTPATARGPRLAVDYLFRSLAEDLGHLAIGIVLSGTGTDGTLGLGAIKAAGGFTFAQEPSTAKYDGMPRSAVASGAADYCLPLTGIADELGRIAAHAERRPAVPAPALQLEGHDQLDRLFALIRSDFGTDLTQYKRSTIDRRLERRMLFRRVETLADYVRFVQQDHDELQALHRDILISVTSFFRDRDAFAALEATVIPQLLKQKRPGEPLRVWVPACATGEEAYSIAMCLLEACDAQARDQRLQIFGTDVDDGSIQRARRGVYPGNITLDVSPERLQRFFVAKDGGFQVARRVRDLLVFSRQNVLRDAPFSRIDLVSCRNLLIYLQPNAQKKTLRIFHYALNPSGYLLLGTSETVGDAPELFAPVDRQNKIYVKRRVAVPRLIDFDAGTRARAEPPRQPVATRPTTDLQGLADRKVLELYGPPGVVVSENLDILQFRGHTGPYLDPAPGTASLNLLKVARLELHVELDRGLRRARAGEAPVAAEVSYPDDGTQCLVRIDIAPLQDPDTGTRCFLVLFHRVPAPPMVRLDSPDPAATDDAQPLVQRIQELERELAVTREHLHTTTEEKESTLEELKSANEELQSSNEELQSTNEELETSKEEMQSTNEELTTLNEELQNRMTELSQSNDDLYNVLAGVDNAVIIVGMDLQVRRYTSAAEKLLGLVPGDIGRSIGIVDRFLGTGTLAPRVATVVNTLSTLEEEVLASNQRWYTLRVAPYKTLDHSIRGALVTLVDINVRKRAVDMTRDVAAYAARFLAAISHPLLILDRALRVVWASDAFLSTFQLSAQETVGSALPSVGARQFADRGLLESLEGVFATGSVLRGHELSLGAPGADGGAVWVGASLIPASPEMPLVLLSIEPIRRVVAGAPP
jgi:two-component system CheB/CheR fusion protein